MIIDFGYVQYDVTYSEYVTYDDIIIRWDNDNGGRNVNRTIDALEWSILMDAVTNNGFFIYPKRPADYGTPEYDWYMWDGVNEEWVIDPVKFTDSLDAALSIHRDSILNTNTHEFIFGLDVFHLSNDERTRGAILGYALNVPIENKDDYIVDYETLDGFFDLTGSMLQKIHSDLTNDLNVKFKAKRHVMDMHAVTPFVSVQDAIDEYNNFIA